MINKDSNDELKKMILKIIRCLVLSGREKCDSIYNRIRYLMSVESGITYITSHNYVKVKVDSHDSLPPEKTNFS